MQVLMQFYGCLLFLHLWKVKWLFYMNLCTFKGICLAFLLFVVLLCSLVLDSFGTKYSRDFLTLNYNFNLQYVVHRHLEKHIKTANIHFDVLKSNFKIKIFLPGHIVWAKSVSPLDATILLVCWSSDAVLMQHFLQQLLIPIRFRNVKTLINLACCSVRDDQIEIIYLYHCEFTTW